MAPGLVPALICTQGRCFLSQEEAGGLAGRNARKPYRLETAKTQGVTPTIHTADITVYTELRTAHKWKRTKQGFASTVTLTARLSQDPPSGTSSPSGMSVAGRAAHSLISLHLSIVTLKAFYNLQLKINLGSLGLPRANVSTISTVTSPLPLTSICKLLSSCPHVNSPACSSTPYNWVQCPQASKSCLMEHKGSAF